MTMDGSSPIGWSCLRQINPPLEIYASMASRPGSFISFSDKENSYERYDCGDLPRKKRARDI